MQWFKAVNEIVFLKIPVHKRTNQFQRDAQNEPDIGDGLFQRAQEGARSACGKTPQDPAGDDPGVK